jgi:hypothetical protein
MPGAWGQISTDRLRAEEVTLMWTAIAILLGAAMAGLAVIA